VNAALQHLLLRLRPFNRALLAALAHKTANLAASGEPRGPLELADELIGGAMRTVPSTSPTAEEIAEIQSLRAAHREPLPFEELVSTLDLSPFEQDAILLCCAPELDRAYEQVYAQLLDAPPARLATVGLISDLTSMNLEQRLARRPLLNPFGKLRRTGILEARGQAPTELRQELAIAPLAFAFLTGAAPRAIDAFRDPSQIALPKPILLPAAAPDAEPYARAIRDRTLRVLAVWGQANSGRDEFVYELARRLVRPLLALPWTNAEESRAVIVQAGATNALLWADLDAQPATNAPPAEIAVERFLHLPAPLLLTSARPVRPTPLLESGTYREVKLPPSTLADRKALWLQVAPKLNAGAAEDLASRFRLSGSEMRAAVAMWSEHESLDAACSTVARKRAAQFASFIEPKRGPGDLVLEPELHRQVLEIASFYRVSARVYETWGFHRVVSGGGIKALFAGDPGTGKTLAAEVIAGQLATPLLKVDLSRVVSKWVGETEKNLESVFAEAEESQAVLFFDEAESLYGKRGEVRHGSDRYSNLEVGYLLQRLESFSGLVILASNLRDQIDSAFLRRFNVVIHFPSPGPAQRASIWKLAFPEPKFLGDSIRLEDLSGLEMSGAAIVGAATTAALLAAEANCDTIELPHVMEAIERQYRRDSKILTPAQLRGLPLRGKR
jgi:hypothetical protein